MNTENAAFEGPSARDIFGEAMGRRQAAPRVIDIGTHGTSVNRVSISGVSRIRAGFLNTLLEPVFAAQTVAQAVAESREAAGKLRALGIAKDVAIELDQAADNKPGVDVCFSCEDGSRYAIRTGVNVGDDEGTAGVTGRLNNIWGGGEALEANYTRGSKTQAAFMGALTVPVRADPQRQAELSATQAAVDSRPYSAHTEVRRTLGAAYRASAFDGTSHELRYSAAWREICNLGAAASPTLRSEAGHTLKSSVAYTFTRDDRDSRIVPTQGNLVRATAELAGLLGDVRFAKAQAELQTSQRIGASEYVVAAGVQGGLMCGLGVGRTPLADRFFLGGQTNVRGFEFRGIGPRDHNDSIGGDVFYAAGVSLLTPLPYVRTPALRGHVWANAGQLALLDDRGLLRKTSRGSAPIDEIRRFLMRPSVAVGLGLVYRHSMVRVELSCGLPLVAALTDRPKAGLQFGLGVQFL
ncbi:hypothetical protein IWW50_000413 [Coemansia erecta]|nr:hypothetical protein GGF43_000204 [Coemansia sp. RSA 2618]KAJ2830212.1 hypothetical protein IWW50_000413 [Coemansia erecta]